MSKFLLTGVLSKLYKMDSEEITELLKTSDLPETSATDAALLQKITELDTVRVKDFNDRAKKRFDDGHKKGKSETMNDLERDLREEYDVKDAELQGIDLIRHIAKEQVAKGNKGGKLPDVTEEAIRKSPIYLNLETRLKTRETELTVEKENAVKAIQTEYKQKENKTVIGKKAIEQLDALKPVLPADAAKAARQKELFLDNIFTSKLELAEDGSTILILGDDNLPAKDPHGHTVKFEDFIKSRAEQTFDFAVTNPKSSAGNGGGSGNGGSGGGSGKQLPTPKNIDELAKAMSNKEFSIEERQQIHTAYEAANSGK